MGGRAARAMTTSSVSVTTSARPAPKAAPGDPVSVFFIAGGLATGGTERHLSLVLPRLLERGIRPRLFAFGADGPMSEPIRDAGIEIEFLLLDNAVVTHLPRPFRGLAIYAGSVFRMWRVIRREKPDICHCFLPMSTIIGGLAAKLAGHKRVVASRRSLRNYQTGEPLLASVERRLIRGMAAVLGNSRAVTEELAAEGVATDRIGLIYNGVDVETPVRGACGTSVRKRLDIPDDALVVLTVANLIPYKGHRDLLAAMAMAADDLPQPWVLLCAGRDDGIGADLERYADSLGIRSNLRLLGECAQIGDLYRAADLSVLSSHQEGFSNALLEALATGCPTIATAVGGNVEAIGEGHAGRLVAPKDPTALAAAIREIGCDVELRRRMSAAAESRARALFSMEACVQHYENLYRGLSRGADRPIDAIIATGDEAQPIHSAHRP